MQASKRFTSDMSQAPEFLTFKRSKPPPNQRLREKSKKKGEEKWRQT